MTVWSNWQDDVPEFVSRYVQWWGLARPDGRNDADWDAQIYPKGVADFAELARIAGGWPDPETSARAAGSPSIWPIPIPQNLPAFPVPTYMNNPDFPAHLAGTDRIEEQGFTAPPKADLPKDTKAVMGIIDLGIALGHRRFRDEHGASRVLSSWQMGAPYSGRSDLPFGHVLEQQEIDALLTQFSNEGLHGPLDQDGFNRAAGLVVTDHQLGPRSLMHRVSHGTHVCDVAAGDQPGGDFGKAVPILAVNLPAPVAFGEGGGFLDFYLIYGLRWILEIYAKLIKGCDPADTPPLIINISIGKFAGARDQTQDFVGELLEPKWPEQAAEGRKAPKTTAPQEASDGVDEVIAGVALNVAMPAGNDNLSQCSLATRLDSRGDAEVTWELPPGDFSSNIIEIWAKVASDDLGTAPIAVDLEPPGHDLCESPAGMHQKGRTLQGHLGRIWCDRFVYDGFFKVDRRRIYAWRHLIALAPSSFQPASGQSADSGAPAGPWKLRIRNLHGEQISVSAAVQSDQVALPFQAPPERSWFDHPEYKRFDDQGRWRDSYTYEEVPEEIDGPGPVRRRGTLNTYAANEAVLCVAGFRFNSGRPALYSATGFGKHGGLFFDVTGDERREPSAAFVSDDGAAHFGILGAGSGDGSAVALSGTSAASALAVRCVLERIVAGTPPDPHAAGPLIVRHVKSITERDLPHYGDAVGAGPKVGDGRAIHDKARHKRRMGR